VRHRRCKRKASEYTTYINRLRDVNL